MDGLLSTLAAVCTGTAIWLALGEHYAASVLLAVVGGGILHAAMEE